MCNGQTIHDLELLEAVGVVERLLLLRETLVSTIGLAVSTIGDVVLVLVVSLEADLQSLVTHLVSVEVVDSLIIETHRKAMNKMVSAGDQGE